MLRFLPLCEEDRKKVSEKLGDNPSKICELCPADFFFWGLNGDAQIAWDKEDLYILWTYGEERGYAYPFAEDERSALEKTVEHARSVGKPAAIIDMTAEQANSVREKLGVTPEFDRDWCDYLYSIKDLCALAGKKYHGQKNHLNKFRKTYPDARFVPYTPELRERAERFFTRYYAVETGTGLFEAEKEVFLSRIKRPDPTEKSGVLLVDDEIVAMTFGEVLGDTLYVHTEKALRAYEGSYVAVNHLFVNAVSSVCPDVLFVNREEDLGDEGLRAAKLSWHPVRLVDKYYARILESKGLLRNASF